MLCFVIPLKSKKVSNSWEIVCRLFENCLYSAYNQTNPDIKIIVACHEVPELRRDYDERVEFIQVDFLPPAVTYEEMMSDKRRKMKAALIRVEALRPDFVMRLDADDLVHKELSAYVHQHKESNGWIFKKGYCHAYGSKWVMIKYSYDQYCGTSSILSGKCMRFPKDAAGRSDDEPVLLAVEHRMIAQKMAEMGTSLMPLPFIGSIYVQSHGDNHSESGGFGGRWKGIRYYMRNITHFRFLTDKIKREFSFNCA